MKQIKKPIKLVLHYLPIGSGYGNKTDGFVSLVINNSKAEKYSTKPTDRDWSVRQLAQYLETCIGSELDEDCKK